MKVKRWEGGGRAGYGFKCPCGDRHSLQTEGPTAWVFNGDVERPVFGPSLLVRTGHYLDTHKPGDPCWCTFNEEAKRKGEEPSSFTCYLCHSFIGCNGAQPGQIVFLGDCTHALAGKVVELPEIVPLS